MKREKKIVKNTTMLIMFNIAKIIFPFVTLPYLTRVLSVETYGSVAYIKTVMNYMQIIVDFGFVLSATKDIVKIRNEKEKMEYVIGDTMIARIIMGLLGLLILILLSSVLPILRDNFLYTLLSYAVVFSSIFLMDFLFRGLEIMHVITIRFILMKIISTVLTFIFVKNDSNLLLIPIFDILSSLVAVALVLSKVKKLKLKMRFSNIKKSLYSIKDSFVYFLSNIASVSFNALSTLIIGIKISPIEVAYWSVCMQVIGTIQSCYTPISDGIYPEMIKSKNLSLIKKIVKFILPVVTIGCLLAYFLAGTVLKVLGGNEYLVAVPIFRLLIPSLFFGFLAVILGWPTLGAIEKTKETTISTIVSILVHIALLLILIMTNSFTLINIAIVRSATEFIFFLIRYYYCRKYKNLFT